MMLAWIIVLTVWLAGVTFALVYGYWLQEVDLPPVYPTLAPNEDAPIVKKSRRLYPPRPVETVILRGNGSDRFYEILKRSPAPKMIRPHGDLQHIYTFTEVEEDYRIYSLVLSGRE